MWLLIVILVVLALLVIYLIVAYNGLIRRRNQVENAWSQIDVQLKRRLDLIPNLVETVKAYAAHERETLDAVIKARNAAIAAPDTPQAQSEADRARSPAHCARCSPSARPTPTSRPTRTSWPCRRS